MKEHEIQVGQVLDVYMNNYDKDETYTLVGKGKVLEIEVCYKYSPAFYNFYVQPVTGGWNNNEPRWLGEDYKLG